MATAPLPEPPPRRRRESPEIDGLRSIVADLREEGRVDDAFEHSFSAVQAVLDHVRELQLKLAALRKKALGSTSERIDARQLELLLEQYAALTDEEAESLDADTEEEARADALLDDELEAERDKTNEQLKTKRKKRRGIDTSKASREEHSSELPEDQRTDPNTGKVAGLIGYDTFEELEYKAGYFVLKVTKVAKYGFGGDGTHGVISAPAPAKVVPRAVAGASLFADIIVSKLADHLPLNRLRNRYLRAGIDIPLSTLADWMAVGCDMLEPIAKRLWKRVEKAVVVRIDASGIKVQDPRASNNIVRGTMWCMVGDDKDVVFRYAEDGTGDNGPWDYLAQREGYVQSDAANIFDRLYNGQVANATEVGCNAHARRKFVALKDTDSRVAYALKLYGRLYKVERLAKLKKFGAEELKKLRQQRSRTLIDKLYRWFVRHAEDDPPDQPFAKAIAYALNHKAALTRFVDDGRLDIDNNLNEQQIRWLALGRKNYLFAGSHDSANRIAVGYTITRTCAMHGVPVLDYVTDVMHKLAAGWSQSRVDELLPDRWMASRDT